MNRLTGMTDNYCIFLLIIFFRKADMIRIRRSAIDTFKETEFPDCRNISARQSPTSGLCTCTTETSTFMSVNNSLVGCKSPTNLSCRESVTLITKNAMNEVRIPFMAVPSTRNSMTTEPSTQPLQRGCSDRVEVYVWNIEPSSQGVWVVVRGGGKQIFNIDSQSVVRINHSNFDFMRGHLFMVTCRNLCTLIKFQGVMDYPFDVALWNSTYRLTHNTTTTTGTGTATKATSPPLLTDTELIIVIVVPTVVAVLLTAMCCIFRRQIFCRRQMWSKRDSTCSKANMTTGYDNDMTNNNIKDPWSPWYDIYKLAEMRRNYLRKPSGDSFHIPTVKGSKERNSRAIENPYEMNMGYEYSSRRTSSRFSCVLGHNPYCESAT